MGSTSGLFLILDKTKVSGDVADVWAYRAVEPGMSVGASLVVETVDHWSINCRDRTYAAVNSAGYDGSGKKVIDLPPFPPEPIKKSSAQDYVSQVMCDGVKLPPQNIIVGHEAARLMVQAMIKGRP
jgi:hypothetical protein